MTKPVCPTGTTYVPGGRFKDGTKVKGVCIDTKPVSNKSYTTFAERNKIPFRPGYRPFAPVVDVSYNGARKYCQSMGMRLPTENEWKWSSVTSRILRPSMRMKSKSGNVFREYMYYERPSGIAWIAFDGEGSGRTLFSSRYISPDCGLDKRVDITFRCAVEPNTYWKNWIVGLGVGLLLLVVEPLLGGARFLGLKDPRTTR